MPFPPSFHSFLPLTFRLSFRHLTKNAAADDGDDDDDEFRRPNTKADAATLVAPFVPRRGEAEGKEGQCKVLREREDILVVTQDEIY